MNTSPQSTFYFWFSSFYQYSCMKYKFGPFWPNLGWWRHHGELNLQNSETVVSKAKTSPKIFLYFWLSSFYHHWYIKYKFGPFLTQFGLMTSRRELKLQCREKVISETNSSLQCSIKYWFQSFYHSLYMIYNFGPFLPNLETMTRQKK